MRKLLSIIVIIALLAASFIGFGTVGLAAGETLDVSTSTTELLVGDKNAVILDVRSPEEFNSGKIPSSINIDIYKGQGFIYLVDELDKAKNFYVYCRSGARSGQACSVMNQMGIQNAYNLLGGIMEWRGEVEY